MQILDVLRESFQALQEQFELTAKTLSQGRRPSLDWGSEVQSLHDTFEEVRKALVAEALKAGMAVPEGLDDLPALERLHEAVEKKRREALWADAEGTLDRVLSLVHREEQMFAALSSLKEEAQSLLRDDADLDTLRQVADGVHPFLHLLKMLEGEVSPEQAEESEQVIEEAFGRSLLVAVMRDRLLTDQAELSEEEAFSHTTFHTADTADTSAYVPVEELGLNEEETEDNQANGAPPTEPRHVEELSSASGGGFVMTPVPVELVEEPTESGVVPSQEVLSVVEEDTKEQVSVRVSHNEESEGPGPMSLLAEGGEEEKSYSLRAPKTSPDTGATTKTTDTLDDLDAPPEGVSSGLQALADAEYASRPEIKQAPMVLASLASEEEAKAERLKPDAPPTDQYPVLTPEQIQQRLSGSLDQKEDDEEPVVVLSEPKAASGSDVSEEEEDDDEALPKDVLPVSIPSIEALAVDAMNAVLVPLDSDGTKDRRDASGGYSRPPSTPRMPVPTFQTPLPLSVTAVPGEVNQKSMQHANQHGLAPGRVGEAEMAENSPSFHHPQEAGFEVGKSGDTNEPPTESSPSPTSMVLDAYDAMLVRAVDPNDPSRCSPLTLWQEEELRKAEHGVAVLFGSSALGLEDLSYFIELSVGAEQLYVLDQVFAPHRFLRQIRQIATRRSDDDMTFVLVSHQTPWDSSWVRSALELVQQMQTSNRPMRIVFVADPPSTWSMIPSIQPLQQEGAMMLSLQPWHDSALIQWLDQLSFPGENKIRRSILRVTGNWSFALKFFYRQMKQNPTQWARHLGSLKQVLDSKELAQKALRIMGLTHKTTLSILQKLAMEEPSTQEAMERAFAHAPPRLITRALLWAERLSLAKYENYFWTIDPLVARLLKALR